MAFDNYETQMCWEVKASACLLLMILLSERQRKSLLVLDSTRVRASKIAIYHKIRWSRLATGAIAKLDE